MFSRSGSTSNGDSGRLPEGSPLWVVHNGHVLASCSEAKAFSSRVFPNRIDRSWTGAAVLYGRLPILGLGSRQPLVAIQLDGALKAIRISRISGLRISFPTARTKVTVVAPEDIVRRFGVSEGDQFELKS